MIIVMEIQSAQPLLSFSQDSIKPKKKILFGTLKAPTSNVESRNFTSHHYY